MKYTFKNKIQEPVNIITIKWGKLYGAEYPNKIFKMLSKNLSVPFRVFCFTDDAKGIDKNIIVKPFTKFEKLNAKKADKEIPGRWFKEAALCDNNLCKELKGQRVLFLDLDIVITDNIDCFFDFDEKDDSFVIINDWTKPSWEKGDKGKNRGQASAYSFKVGTLGFIKDYFEQNPKEVMDKFDTASQEYLSSKVIEWQGCLKFWPKSWCRSFRFCAVPKFFLFRWFFTPKLPKDCKILVFHGAVNPADAVKGYWPVKKGQGWKKLYKHIKPSKWLKKYM